ncbi:MAG: tRNA (adenosine(37)-N6)-dimethylallyltransferase MiaA [Verrucomicrobia bacterium]|nr:tRNA (adenosine(37)-N6)-dimethylallyltransferase MiaA [Verrucomicrobiota bacterium]
MDPVLHILTGYTSVGKTRLSLDWAKQNQAEIISCDSLLFYRHMDIGTAKPSRGEMAEVTHHMIDVTNVSEQYSINEYVRQVKDVAADIYSRGKQVLVVGGSGFYLNAFFAPVVDGLSLEPAVQRRIEHQFENQPLSDSVAVLRTLNPHGLGDLDVANPRRVLKAWLRCLASGKTLEQLKQEFGARAGAFDQFEKRLIVLSRAREELEERVRIRVDAMLSAGLVEEVRQLLSLGIERNPSAAGAIGYRETIAFLRGDLPESKLAENITRNTRKLLKKQRTWFKKFLPHGAVYDISSLEKLPGLWHRLPKSKSTP